MFHESHHESTRFSRTSAIPPISETSEGDQMYEYYYSELSNPYKQTAC